MKKESLFINEYRFNEDILRKYVKKFTRSTRNSSLILAVMAAILSLIEFRGGNNIFAAIAGAASLILLLVYILYIPISMGKIKKEGNISKDISIDFRFDNIIIKDGDVESKLKYSGFTEITEDDENLYLSLGKDRGLVVRKDGFKMGKDKEFKKFINTKVPKVQRNAGGG